MVRKAINILIFIAVIITFLPLCGFGAYIDMSDENNIKCLRYRDAKGFWNKTYSVLFMLFGKFGKENIGEKGLGIDFWEPLLEIIKKLSILVVLQIH